MKAATMFSGIGAPECAALHWNWKWHAEIEAFPSAVMKTRHPRSVNLGDVNAADFCEKAEAAGRPDVIVWGSPCQDYSVAGARLGLDGARGNLSLVALGIIRKLRPRWFLFENVPGLFSSYSGSAEAQSQLLDRASRTRDQWLTDGLMPVIYADEDSDFAAFLSAVRECGYLGSYRVLDAQYAGVPQRRRRIFFVGYLGDWRPAVSVLFDPESLRGNPPPSRAPGQRIAPTLDARTDGGGAGWGTDFMASGGLAAGGEERGLDLQGLRGDERGRELADLRLVRAEADDLNPDIAWALQERDAKGADSSTKDGHLIVQAFDTTGGQLAIATRAVVRRLTPKECERLQGFEDDYTLIQYRGKPAADGPRYKALGNSMCVTELKWILGRIERFEQEVLK